MLVRRYIKFGIAALKHQNNGRLPDTRRPGDIAATVLAYGLHYDSNHDANINDVNIGEAGSDNESEPAADTSATDAQILQYHEAMLGKSFAVVWTCWTTYLRTFSKPAAWRDAFPGHLPPRHRVVPKEDAAAVTAAATASAAAAAAAAGGPAAVVTAAAAKAAAKAAKAADEAADAAYLHPRRDFMRSLPLQKFYRDAAESGKYGYLPLMATHSRCGVGSLLSSSFCERINSQGKIVLDKSNSSLGRDMVSMLTTLRMNREFARKLRHLYADADFQDLVTELGAEWATGDLFDIASDADSGDGGGSSD